GVVATELVVVRAEGRAVDGGPKKHGPRLAVGGVDAQYRHAAIRQPARVDAQNNAVRRELPPVHREVDHAAAPPEPGGFQPPGRSRDGLNDLVLQLARVLDGAQGLAGARVVPGGWLQEELWPGVRVGGVEEDLLAPQPGLLPDAVAD